jgi:hypothetical protein
MSSKYAMPDSLKGLCDQAKYARWLQRKAAAHVKRDRKRARRNMRAPAIAFYKQMIHAAVSECKGDFYTGLPLDWSLISKWENVSAKMGGAEYKRSFLKLPTVDHTVDENGSLRFVICASYVNHAKSDLNMKEFYELCEDVLAHRDRKAANK